MREKRFGIDIVGILAALLPFVFHFSSTTTRNGVTTSYFDSFGVFGGVVAIASRWS